MASPNHVDEFVPYRLLVFLRTQLEQIAEARGYNCNVAVFTDWDKYGASDAKFVLMLETAPENPLGHFVGSNPTVQPSQSFMISGNCRYEDQDEPRRLAMSLEQDVRTAIHSGAATLRNSVGRGCSFRFTGCRHDGGALSVDKEAGFELTVSFTWSQGSDW